jgi:hypothetical protein
MTTVRIRCACVCFEEVYGHKKNATQLVGVCNLVAHLMDLFLLYCVCFYSTSSDQITSKVSDHLPRSRRDKAHHTQEASHTGSITHRKHHTHRKHNHPATDVLTLRGSVGNIYFTSVMHPPPYDDVTEQLTTVSVGDILAERETILLTTVAETIPPTKRCCPIVLCGESGSGQSVDRIMRAIALTQTRAQRE